MPSLIDNAGHWRRRAAEARKIAGAMADGPAKDAMLGIAANYDAIAAQAALGSISRERLE
jgi:hypothetical protein